MEKNSRAKSTTFKVAVLVAILIVTIVGVYAALTYPRTLIDFPVSFTLGADVERKEFDVSILHSQVQVEVIVNSGTSLWTAQILSQDETLWTHAAYQGGQTTYKSDWIKLSSGHYNFTFATAGLGSLEAEIKLTSKGGFW